MNGVLLQDAHLLRLMEKNGDGVYLNGKLNATGGLELNKGIFLTTGQMKGLRQCFGNSKQAAARCASGWIE
mgnify:FL=1